jgi:hypothetical protein
MIVVTTGLLMAWLGWSAPRAEAAKFNVYYRASEAAPWTYYAGSETDAVAKRIADSIQTIGYLTEIIRDGEEAKVPSVNAPKVTDPRYVVEPRGKYVHVNAGGGAVKYTKGEGTRVVNHGTSVSSSSYVGAHTASHASKGSTVHSATTHHYDHQHAHLHAGAAALAHHHAHPTHHPHHAVAHHHTAKAPHHKAGHAAAHAHRSGHAAHHGTHHAHHHGGHHSHSHAHHHSHSHSGHHGKR